MTNRKKLAKSVRGRPAFKATKEIREKVERLVAANMTQTQIAAAIGCAVKTLRRHFKDELTHGKARVKAWLINTIWDRAKRGDVESQILLCDMAIKKSLDVYAGPASQVAPLGKKAQLQKEAETYDAIFSPPQPPPKKLN